jgi:hypothetical protein
MARRLTDPEMARTVSSALGLKQPTPMQVHKIYAYLLTAGLLGRHRRRAAVERGDIAVSTAAEIATQPPEVQVREPIARLRKRKRLLVGTQTRAIGGASR